MLHQQVRKNHNFEHIEDKLSPYKPKISKNSKRKSTQKQKQLVRDKFRNLVTKEDSQQYQGYLNKPKGHHSITSSHKCQQISRAMSSLSRTSSSQSIRIRQVRPIKLQTEHANDTKVHHNQQHKMVLKRKHQLKNRLKTLESQISISGSKNSHYQTIQPNSKESTKIQNHRVKTTIDEQRYSTKQKEQPENPSNQSAFTLPTQGSKKLPSEVKQLQSVNQNFKILREKVKQIGQNDQQSQMAYKELMSIQVLERSYHKMRKMKTAAINIMVLVINRKLKQLLNQYT